MKRYKRANTQAGVKANEVAHVYEAGAQMARWEVETQPILGTLRSVPGVLRWEEQRGGGRWGLTARSSDPHTYAPAPPETHIQVHTDFKKIQMIL